ncbi:MAG: BLUF domain-containing protein [Pseudomonadota bacterium]
MRGNSAIYLGCPLCHGHALVPDDLAEHIAIRATCKRNNDQTDITGILHREDDFFVQDLEGIDDVLDASMARISADPRHADITVVYRSNLITRRLPDWQMGFVDGRQLSLIDVVGVRNGKFDIKVADPVDLIDFVINNADALCGEVLAA